MIYIECNNDHSLMKFLGLKYLDDFKHPDGKGGVLRSLKNTNISLGIVDEDAGSYERYPRLNNFTLKESKNNLRLYNHSNVETRKLIEIPGNIEQWFRRISQLEGLNLDNFRVLDSRGNFRKQFPNGKEQDLFDFIDAISDNGSLITLRDWIEQYG